ncbi:MAG: hypothetical protein R3335_13070 [Anaerolineales bacterium]|nr:hypothetical protein [Anaerolineales bacterium]
MASARIFSTRVAIKPVVLLNIAALWTAAAWIGISTHPGRTPAEGLTIGFLAMALMLAADIGHALAHNNSARYANAPMDEVLISAGMPRNIYYDQDISPRAHMLRALGGPIFSVAGLLISRLVFASIGQLPVARELSAWSTLGHGFILVGCLLLPLTRFWGAGIILFGAAIIVFGAAMGKIR